MRPYPNAIKLKVAHTLHDDVIQTDHFSPPSHNFVSLHDVGKGQAGYIELEIHIVVHFVHNFTGSCRHCCEVEKVGGFLEEVGEEFGRVLWIVKIIKL